MDNHFSNTAASDINCNKSSVFGAQVEFVVILSEAGSVRLERKRK